MRSEKERKKESDLRAYTCALTRRLTENYNYEPRGVFARYKNLKLCRVAPFGARFAAVWSGLARQAAVN